uniref:Rho-GAP domain-containing protein n=1 Tax=Neogobius melanostomus TaxID=47308 RepID=A0A8C6TL88_9GOBI
MDATNLSRVFGPTLVGHAVPDPDPTTILQDTNRQPRVVERLLSIPAAFWTQFAHPDNEEREQLASNVGEVSCPRTQRQCAPSGGGIRTPDLPIMRRSAPLSPHIFSAWVLNFL